MTPPDDPDDDSALPGRRRRTPVPVWAAAILIVLLLTVVASGNFRIGGGTVQSSAVGYPPDGEGASFYDWPLKRHLQVATMVALTEHLGDGSDARSFLREVLWRRPDVLHIHQAGERFDTLDPGDELAGDGMVVFFAGSPPAMYFATTYRDGRVSHFRDLSIEELRAKLVAGERQ